MKREYKGVWKALECEAEDVNVWWTLQRELIADFMMIMQLLIRYFFKDINSFYDSSVLKVISWKIQ